MTRLFRIPRLLPVTIAMLAAVWVAKTVVLVRAAILDGRPAAWITTAQAAGPDVAKPVEAPPVVDAAPPGPPPVTDAERAVLLELRDRRKELDAREATLTSRESMLAAAETKLSERVGELQTLQKKLESLDASHRQQEDVAWMGLVKVYETMKPRDAAAIFNDLGMSVLLSVVDRMKEAKAAAILAAMIPDKARDVTTQLALLRTRGAAAVETGDKPVLTPEPGKAPGSGT
jgi:flagellar motility protein MotE (MotC chaperone)